MDNDSRMRRIDAALGTIRGKLAESKKAVAERDTLRKQLEAVTKKWQALLSATYWAELDSGTSISVGTTARYFGRNYACIKAHTKALLRSPLNKEYWEEVKDDE